MIEHHDGRMGDIQPMESAMAEAAALAFAGTPPRAVHTGTEDELLARRQEAEAAQAEAAPTEGDESVSAADLAALVGALAADGTMDLTPGKPRVPSTAPMEGTYRAVAKTLEHRAFTEARIPDPAERNAALAEKELARRQRKANRAKP